MPRSVPLTLLKEMLDCTSSVESELSANSRRHQMRAKKPRSSPKYSGSIRNAPDRSVSEKIIGARLAPSESCENHLPAVEGLGEPGRRPAFHPSQSQHGHEEIFGEPGLAPLTLEGGEEGLHLHAGGLLVQMNEDVGTPEVTIVFRNLVLEDQMVAEGVPGEFAHHAVILVDVVPVVRQHEVWRHLSAQGIEPLLELRTHVWEIAHPEVLDDHSTSLRLPEKGLGTPVGLGRSSSGCAQDNPIDRDTLASHLEQL